MERDEWRRAAWRVTVAGTLDSSSLVFVDEMGTNTSLAPLYGWAKKGERAYSSVPRNRGKNTTVLASMSVEGMGPTLAVEGSTNATAAVIIIEPSMVDTIPERTMSVPGTMIASMMTPGSRFLVLAVGSSRPT